LGKGKTYRCQSSQIETKAIDWYFKDMCQSCVEIDELVELHRELLRSTIDPAEIERINQLIANLFGDRLRLHQNPER
jgi:hypothetical protein